MTDLLKIGAVFAFIILLLRLRWNLGLVMLIGSVTLGALYLIGPMRQARIMFDSSIDPVTINLVTGLVLIMVLENIIRKRGVLKRMMEAVVNVARHRRIAMAVLPGTEVIIVDYGGVLSIIPALKNPVKQGRGLLKGLPSLTKDLRKERAQERSREAGRAR